MEKHKSKLVLGIILPPQKKQNDQADDMHLCTYEIVYWDPLDDIYSILYYYVRLDEQGRVIYVERRGGNRNEAGEYYDYWDRWGV